MPLSAGLLLAVALRLGAARPLNTRAGPKAGVLNVHLVPHTHDDVGWLKTVDQYYIGLNNTIQNAAVKYVLDSVVAALARNPDRKFTYVEQAFFQRWWREQDGPTRELVRQLVKAGQLQFANGGWCMHDEATPHYIDMIDQTTTGHRFLMEQFGVCPKVGWQIDPFGHSATQAALLSAEVGFVGLFFGRIDYEDLGQRQRNKSCEFVWRASRSLGKGAQVFSGLTGEYGGNYGPPDGFSWDVFSNDEPVQDDRAVYGYNVKGRVDDFVSRARDLARMTRGEHVMFTMGSDFQYQAAEKWYSNMDRIIHHANLDGRVNAFYSSPEAYVAAKAAEASVSWPLKTDDFFPYASGPHSFWTGYFTSRPATKRYVRESSAFFQLSKQLLALTGAEPRPLQPLAEALGVVQHHDAVSGTEKQHVANDYALRIAAARAVLEPAAGASVASLAGGRGRLHFCGLRNVSVCAATQALGGAPLPFAVWNALAQPRAELVELPVDAPARVVDLSGREQPSQLVEALPSTTEFGRPAGGAKWTLLFGADLPPLGLRAFRLEPASAAAAPMPRQERSSATEPTVLESDLLRVEFCAGSNLLCRITDKSTGLSVKAQQNWLWYKASTGNKQSGQASGAYAFRPESPEARAVSQGAPTLQVSRGPLAQEALQSFGPWVSQRVRLAKGARHVEITYTVGPIPVEDGIGREVISRFSTELQNSGECFTDSNGREMLRRRRDFRASWNYNATDHGEPVSGNYYPVTTAIHIRDARAQLTVLTDRAQAGSGSVRDGELELMVHRRVLKDDNFGVSEPLNETEFTNPYGIDNVEGGAHRGRGLVIRGQHQVLVGPPGRAAAAWRPQMDRLFQPPAPFFAPGAGASLATPQYKALQEALPANVQLVTLERLDGGALFVRLAHQFGVEEDEELSKPATVDLAKLFVSQRVADVREMGLSGTITRAEVLQGRVGWKVEGEEHEPASAAAGGSRPGTTEVTLGPLQIRTFQVTLAPSVSYV